MSYYDTYVQGYTLRQLYETVKKRKSRQSKPREKRIADLDENGK